MLVNEHIAHLNRASLRAPVDSPVVAEFVDAIDRVNSLAERCDRFVGREIRDEADLCRAIDWPVFDSKRAIVSFSIWNTPDARERADALGANGPTDHAFTFAYLGERREVQGT